MITSIPFEDYSNLSLKTHTNYLYLMSPQSRDLPIKLIPDKNSPRDL